MCEDLKDKEENRQIFLRLLINIWVKLLKYSHTNLTSDIGVPWLHSADLLCVLPYASHCVFLCLA